MNQTGDVYGYLDLWDRGLLAARSDAFALRVEVSSFLMLVLESLLNVHLAMAVKTWSWFFTGTEVGGAL